MKEKILDLLRSAEDYLSGQEICEQFGVSRTAVWKVIRQLEEEGYVINAVRNRGYRLIQEPDVLNADRVRACLHTKWAGKTIRYFDSIDSTNAEAKRQAENGAEHGLLVISDHQTAGRGRRGRVWESQKGEGIFVTLLLKPDIEPVNASMLTLVMGLAVRDALAQVEHLDVQIKWPNDIVCDGKKICGILTEMSAQMDYINHIVIGLGINVYHQTFPAEMEQIATSIYQQTGARISRAELIAEVMDRFETYYAQYLKTQNLFYLMDRYNEQLINRGRKVQVLDAKAGFSGTAIGINEIGELLVQTDEGVRSVSAGEVSVRGVYGYV